MNKKLAIYLFVGFFFVTILGSLSHFFFEWSNGNKLVALFCPVNESTWEHMKLLFFPMLLYTACIIYRFPKNDSILTASLFGNIYGTASIPVFFYTYSGILGYNITFIDISIFYISVFYAFCKVYLIARNYPKNFTNCADTANSFSIHQNKAQNTSSAPIKKLFCSIHRFFKSLQAILCRENIAVGLTFLFIILFFVFAFYPPNIAIFENPV